MMRKALGMTACVVAVTALTIAAAALFFGLAFSVLVPDKGILPGDGNVGVRGWPLGALALFARGFHGSVLGYLAGQRILETMSQPALGAPVLTGLLVAIGMSLLIMRLNMDGAFEAVTYYGPVSLPMIVVFVILANGAAIGINVKDWRPEAPSF